jgi:ribosome biogenesis GTPase
MTNINESGEIFDRRKKINSKYNRTEKRILVKESQFDVSSSIKGQLISQRGKNFIVKYFSSEFEVNYLECVASGTFYSSHGNSTLLAVGDFVNFSFIENTDLGKIQSVNIRQSWISRKPLIGSREDVIASNVGYTAIIASADEPLLNTRLIDRIIVASEIGNIRPIIVVNKTDLLDMKFIRNEMSVYAQLGYKIFYVSVLNNFGLEPFAEFLKLKDTVFIGASGVGKSSLINYLIAQQEQKIVSVSQKWKKGKHTTSFSRIFQLDSDTTIIDTPGIREFGLVNIEKNELGLYFKEFENFYEHCRYMPCTHTHEPDCEVKNAVTNSKINQDRYQSYLNIFDSL